MGAAAISTLAGAMLIAASESSPVLLQILPFVRGLTLMWWATATWWIPMLLVLGVWRHGYRRFPLRYDPLYWGAVFPLGMYTVATVRLSRALALRTSLESRDASCSWHWPRGSWSSSGCCERSRGHSCSTRHVCVDLSCSHGFSVQAKEDRVCGMNSAYSARWDRETHGVSDHNPNEWLEARPLRSACAGGAKAAGASTRSVALTATSRLARCLLLPLAR